MTAGLLIVPAGPLCAFFPFSFGKEEIKTDYSQTVWDRMMLEQSAADMRRGMDEMSRARYKEATDSFARAVIKNAKSPLPYLLLGASLYWSGKVEEAVSEYKEAQRLDPKNPLSYQLLGIAAGWKGDVKQAQEYFLQANSLDENKADTHMNLGSTYAVERNWEKALEHFRRAVELAPQEPLYHYQLGTLYESMGRDEQAEESFKKALRLFPLYEDAQLSLGALEEKLNRPQEALKYYKKAVHTKPGDYVARLRYAFLLAKQGNKKKAREVLAEAFSITRFKPEGLALNAVYRASGRSAEDFKERIEDFKKGLEKVSASKAVNIEVSLEYNPVSSAPKNTTRRGQTFEQAYQTLRPENAAQDGLAPRAFKRMFTLPETTAEERQQQIDNLISGLEQAVLAGSGKYNVNLSMQGRTVDFASPSALTQNNLTAPKAVYDPRIVGNDMGLWVMGRTWIFFVEDAAAELQDSLSVCAPDNLCELLMGVAALARGNSGEAAQAFLASQNKNPQDVLSWLGLGTAAVVAGQDDEARTHYERALRLEPKNKIAVRNLKVLAE